MITISVSVSHFQISPLTEINNNMRFLLFGGGGQVGHALQAGAPFADRLVVVTRRECDLTDADSLRTLVRRVRPDVMVNAAAYTAVDKAESDRETCFAVNATAPAVMATEAAALGAKLVHYSTDYVFEGTRWSRMWKRIRPVRGTSMAHRSLPGEQGIAASRRRVSHLAHQLGVQQSWCEFLEDDASPAHGTAGTSHRCRSARRAYIRRCHRGRHCPDSEEANALGLGKRRLSHDGGRRDDMVRIRRRRSLRMQQEPDAVAGANCYGRIPDARSRPANSVLSNDRFAANFGFRLPDWEQQLDAVDGGQERGRLGRGDQMQRYIETNLARSEAAGAARVIRGQPGIFSGEL